jgi:hypothetical protein
MYYYRWRNKNSQGDDDMQVMKKRGPPFGNQNARKHGYYSKTLTEAELQEMRKAALADDMSPDITLMKIKIRSILSNDLGNKCLLGRALLKLSMLVVQFYGIDVKDKETLQPALSKEFREIFEPLGMWEGGPVSAMPLQ